MYMIHKQSGIKKRIDFVMLILCHSNIFQETQTTLKQLDL